MLTIKYTSLCHYPSLVSNDCITLAILFYIENSQEIMFEKIKNWQRVSSFNDELDIGLLKIQMEDIEDELKNFVKTNNFKLEKYTKFYVNSIQFTPITTVTIQNNYKDQFIDECKRQYFYCDIDKEKRPTIDEQMQYIKKYLSNEDVSSNGKINGFFNENINFDLKIGNYLFKKFIFKGKNPNRLIKSMKEWAYDAYKLKETYKVIFITDIDLSQSQNNDYKLLLSILTEECDKIINTTEFLGYIKNIIDTSQKSKQVILSKSL